MIRHWKIRKESTGEWKYPYQNIDGPDTPEVEVVALEDAVSVCARAMYDQRLETTSLAGQVGMTVANTMGTWDELDADDRNAWLAEARALLQGDAADE